jgi:hypothetical protein
MNTVKTLSFSKRELHRASKKELLQMILLLRTQLCELQNNSAIEITALKEKLAEKEAALSKVTNNDINKSVNQPSSKQPECNKDTGACKKIKTAKKLTKDENVQTTDQSQPLKLLTTSH